jgi:hypothetical protein
MGKTDTMGKMRSISICPLLISVILLGVDGAPASTGATVDTDGGVLVVAERAGEIELVIDPVADGLLPLPKRRFYVAVPPGATVRAVRVGGTFAARDAAADELEAFERAYGPGGTDWFPLEPVTVSGPFTYRKTLVVAVDCYSRQINPQSMRARDWSDYRVVVRYPPSRAAVDRKQVDPFLVDLVVNEKQFPPPVGPVARSAGQGGADPQFSKSPNWIKMQVDRRGVYAVTGADLGQVVPLASVGDPRTFRVFTGSGFEQDRDLSDPGASWRPGNWMTETAIHVEGDADGVFDVGDRIVFYAVGAEGWMDFYDATAPDTVYHTHGRATVNYYYLTWEGSFSGQALRMAEVAAAPAAVPDRTTFRERVYLEQNKISDWDYGGDFWLWEKIPRGTEPNHTRVLQRVDVFDLITSVPQEFRTVALAPYTGKSEIWLGSPLSYDTGHHAHYKNTPSSLIPTTIGHYRWDASTDEYSYEHGRPVKFSGDFLSEGTNRLDLELPRDDNPKDWMYFAWLSLTYERRLRARGDRLGFDSPDSTGTVNFLVTGFGSSGDVHVFDVSDRSAVRRLTGLDVADAGGGSRRVRFSASLNGGRAHYWAVTDGAIMEVPSLRKIDPVDLRNVTSSPRMVIVTPALPSFRSAAERLAAFRRNHLARFGTGTVSVVTTEQIYDNFSGGQADPFAIRNYIKFLYELDGGAGAPTLAYVLLFGDANMDFKNHASTTVDHVPTFLHDLLSRYEETFATDEWYAHMDVSDQTPGYGVGDVGIGRLPAASSSEANAMVDKIIAYENQAPFGDWRNQVILVADDEGPVGHSCEPWFTNQSEFITYRHLPQYVDVKKIYLADYPSLAGPKPAARRDLLEHWNAGAVAIHYVGHGSSVQIADEIVFVDDDVPKLNNGLMLPIFMALSCTVGDFANPTKKSLSEELLLKNDGGAIGTVTASALSGVFTNEYLSYALFEYMLPRKPGDKMALGEDVMRAKLDALAGRCTPDTVPCGFANQELNNWKYNLLSDPSLRIKAPQREILLTPVGPDTLVAGVRKTLRGRVMDNGSVDTSFDGTVTVRVHEPDQFNTSARCALAYRLRGGTIYRGSADVVQGEFTIDFRVPRYAEPGPGAFFTAYADDNGGIDAGASLDSTLALSLPTLADSLALVPVDGAPRVQFGFKSGLKVVKPGESLQAIIRDQDGINVLNTTAEGRQALLIDDSPVPFDVTGFFEFDHGGTDTSGVLTYPLPELSVGKHRAILRVADSFAQTTLDTLEFAVTDPMDYFADVVMNYPNPFATTTQFLIRLSNRASIRLDIFTVSGKRIRRLETVRDGGEEWIEWDGRDQIGDEIANGTYLYVATVDFEEIDRPPLVIRGKLTKIQ